jgi:hypothetical protein
VSGLDLSSIGFNRLQSASIGLNRLQSAAIGLNQPRLASIDASRKRCARRTRCIFAQTDRKTRRVKGWQLMSLKLDLEPPGFA